MYAYVCIVHSHVCCAYTHTIISSLLFALCAQFCCFSSTTRSFSFCHSLCCQQHQTQSTATTTVTLLHPLPQQCHRTTLLLTQLPTLLLLSLPIQQLLLSTTATLLLLSHLLRRSRSTSVSRTLRHTCIHNSNANRAVGLVHSLTSFLFSLFFSFSFCVCVALSHCEWTAAAAAFVCANGTTTTSEWID